MKPASLFYPLLVFTCLLFARCAPLEHVSSSSTPNIALELADRSYESHIRMVKLYPNTGNTDDLLQPPVVHISQTYPLTLVFDEILSDFQQYNAYIIHCNYNWEKSALTDMEYMDTYNALPVNDYRYSQNTMVPYTEYSLSLPKVKKSGNYVVVVYKGNRKSDIVLSQRFMVFETATEIQSEVRISSSVDERENNHQVEFSVNYGSIKSTNPLKDFKAVVRQNQRWDNALFALQPTLVREDQKYLEYRNFTLQNNFKATREFRFFDIRPLSYNGRNVAKIEKNHTEIRAFLHTDASRFQEAYSYIKDIDGNFVPGSLEPNTGDMQTDYVRVMFFLKAEEPANGDVYVAGGFNHWQKTPENRMIYDELSGLYTTALLLKQGFYNYMYMAAGEGIDPYLFEGYNYQAENRYEVMVYYRPSGAFHDRLVGYQTIAHNNSWGN